MKKYEFDLEKFDLERVIFLLEELHKILIENKGDNFAPGIRGLLTILSDEKVSLKERTDDARTFYRQMLGGMGTLSEYTIRENKGNIEEFELGKYLNSILNEIWDRLDCSLSFLPDVER